MATDIYRDFDPNLDIPEELKNVRIVEPPYAPDDETGQTDDGDDGGGELGVPSSFIIVSQTLRRLATGNIVVDVVIEVEDIDGAENYEVRMTT